MKSFALLSACAVLLSACAGDTFKILYSGLPKFTGKNISMAADYFGAPDIEKSFASKKYYTWRNERTINMTKAVQTQNTGRVGNQGYSATSTTWVDEPMHISCDLTFITDKRNIIQKYEYEGSWAACNHFSYQIEELADLPINAPLRF